MMLAMPPLPQPEDEEKEKRGPGRPRTIGTDARARNVVVRVGGDLEPELEALARDHGSVSEGIRHLIEQSAERRARNA